MLLHQAGLAARRTTTPVANFLCAQRTPSLARDRAVDRGEAGAGQPPAIRPASAGSMLTSTTAAEAAGGPWRECRAQRLLRSVRTPAAGLQMQSSDRRGPGQT
jgi:hypothetical protein